MDAKKEDISRLTKQLFENTELIVESNVKVERTVSDLNAKISSLEHQNKVLTDLNKTALDQVKKLKSEREFKQQDRDSMMASIQKLKDKVQHFKQRTANAEETMAQLTSQHKTLEDTVKRQKMELELMNLSLANNGKTQNEEECVICSEPLLDEVNLMIEFNRSLIKENKVS